MAIKLFGISDWVKDLRERRPILGEIVKQVIDQPLHVVMTFASVWAIAFLMSPLGAIVSTVGGVLGTAGWNIYREYRQWPSSRWWDPYLDWFFEASGIALGAWTWISYLA